MNCVIVDQEEDFPRLSRTEKAEYVKQQRKKRLKEEKEKRLKEKEEREKKKRKLAELREKQQKIVQNNVKKARMKKEIQKTEVAVPQEHETIKTPTQDLVSMSRQKSANAATVEEFIHCI